MRLRELESALGCVAPFVEPVAALEQYPTSAHLAACMLHAAHARGDIDGCRVLDLGCGGGVLAIGAALLGAPAVLGVDVDAAALRLAAANAEAAGAPPALDLLRADVLDAAGPRADAPLGAVDTVVMNPPFGTKRRGVDTAFLQAAVQHARGGAVYSLHKSSTRDFVGARARAWGTQPEVIACMRFDVPAMYAFHRQASVDVEVDLWRLDCSETRAVPMPDPHSYVAAVASVPEKQHQRGKGKGGKGRGKGKGKQRR